MTPIASKPMRHALAGCLGMALLVGCAPRRDVVAQVGSRSITVSDFNDVATRVQARYLGPPESAKAQLLQDLVQRALLLEAAKANSLQGDSLTRVRREAVQNQALSGALLERVVPNPIPVSEAEARKWYEWRGQQAHLQLIYAPDRVRADAAMAELARGADFARTSDRFSLPGTVPPGGDLGMVSPGSLVAPLDGYLREAPVGKVIGPVQAAGEGWFVLRVLDRQTVTQEPFEMQRATLMDMVRQRKQRQLMLRAFQKLRAQYRVQVDPDGPHILFARYNRVGGGAPPEPTAAEMSAVLGRYDDGSGRTVSYTLKDALADLERGADRPNPAMLSSLEQWIESRAVERAVGIEAERRHLHEEPAIRKRIDEQVDNYLLDAVYQNQVVYPARITEADVQAAYRRQSPLFNKVRSVSVQYLVLPDSASAASVLDHVRSAKHLKDAIVLSSPGMRVREEIVRFPDPAWSSAEFELRTLPAGSYAGPVASHGGWVAYQVVARDESITPFDKLPPDVQEGLRNEAQGAAVERRLAQLTDSLRAGIPVRIDRERLAAIPWPPVDAAPASGSIHQTP